MGKNKKKNRVLDKQKLGKWWMDGCRAKYEHAWEQGEAAIAKINLPTCYSRDETCLGGSNIIGTHILKFCFLNVSCPFRYLEGKELSGLRNQPNFNFEVKLSIIPIRITDISITTSLIIHFKKLESKQTQNRKINIYFCRGRFSFKNKWKDGYNLQSLSYINQCSDYCVCTIFIFEYRYTII